MTDLNLYSSNNINLKGNYKLLSNTNNLNQIYGIKYITNHFTIQGSDLNYITSIIPSDNEYSVKINLDIQINTNATMVNTYRMFKQDWICYKFTTNVGGLITLHTSDALITDYLSDNHAGHHKSDFSIQITHSDNAINLYLYNNLFQPTKICAYSAKIEYQLNSFGTLFN